MALLNFNANTVEPNTPMETLPAGEYKVEITDSEMKPTKTGGEYLQLTLKVVEGNFANRLLWDRLNLVNANATAQSIAQATLSQICRSIGRMNVSDSSELHGIPLVAKVVVKDDPQYGPKNEVKGYKSAGVATVPSLGNGQGMHAQNGPAVTAQAHAASPSNQGAPWNRAAS